MTQLDGDLGGYRLVRPIGRGGMGEVYLGRDLRLERDVAVKLLPAASAADHEARRRLIREAQAAARLDHPCICAVHDVGEARDGRVFVVMPLLQGETLGARLARGPLPVREALQLAQHLAEALGAAHAEGIVHRDLKPQNVMLTPSGPKLLDFGVAKFRPGGAAAAEASTASGDTGLGAVVGTPAYMAPEQIAGADVDARSDLFALGALLFECLTGRRAFQGQNVFDVAAAIAHDAPPAVSSLRRDVPSGIDDLCARLLAKDPADRFETAEEVVGALRLLAGGSGALPLPAPSPRWRRGWARRLGMAAAIAGSLVGGYLLYAARQRLPVPSADAQRWYERGTDFIRDGAYHSAAEALDQALRLFPEFPLAYARQAEALAELDDQGRAREQLLRLQSALGDEARLSADDRLRVRGIRALVLRDLPEAVTAYRQLVERAPGDAGVWVDLGRAQEAAEQRADARASYRRALALDRDQAPAHLRLASLDAQAGQRDAALQSYAEAERVFTAATNIEGQTEVLLRRGAFLDATGDMAAARRDLERAQALATSSGAFAQSVRARLALGSLLASEGRLAEAEGLVVAAIDDARQHELWTLVADGLIDLAGVLVNQPERLDEADRQVQEATRLAEGRGARRTAARAALQRAALALQRPDPGLARTLATSTLPFLSTQGYRRLELTALSIVSRAERLLDDLTAAGATASRVLQAARDLHDDAQVAIALTSLAAIAAARGDLPAALEMRTEAGQLNRRMGRHEVESFDLAGRAELLIRLGRTSDAAPLLAELDDGLRRRDEAFVGRAPRLRTLRALAAVVDGDAAAVERHARSALDEVPRATGAVAADALALLDYALAERSRPAIGPVPTPPKAPIDEREWRYWRAVTAFARSDFASAATHAERALALTEHAANDELTWRVAAVAAQAAAGQGRSAEAARWRAVAVAARARVRAAWRDVFQVYDRRADLTLWRQAVAASTTGEGR